MGSPVSDDLRALLSTARLLGRQAVALEDGAGGPKLEGMRAVGRLLLQRLEQLEQLEGGNLEAEEPDAGGELVQLGPVLELRKPEADQAAELAAASLELAEATAWRVELRQPHDMRGAWAGGGALAHAAELAGEFWRRAFGVAVPGVVVVLHRGRARPDLVPEVLEILGGAK